MAADQSLETVLINVGKLTKTNRSAEARQLLDAYLLRHPDDAQALVRRGFLDNPGDFKSCRRFLTKALSVTKGGAGIGELQQVYIVRAYANGNLGLKDEALQDIEKARQIAPGNPEVYHIRGGIKERFKMYGEALADLEKAATGDPRNVYCVNQLINLAARLHKTDTQLKWLNKSVELFPSFDSFYNRSMFYASTGRTKLAAADALRCLEFKPDDRKAYALAYSSVLNAGDLTGAERVLQRARMQFPKDKGFRVSQADLKLLQNDPDRALTLYRELSRSDPDDPYLQEQIGGILRDQQRYEEALEQFSAAAKFREPKDDALRKRAECYRLAEQYTEAARDFTQLYSKTSNRVFIVDAGDCWLHNNNYKRALSTFEIALGSGPAKPLSGEALARVYASQALCYLRLGDPQKARGHATKSLSVKPNVIEAILVRSQANTQLKRIDEAIADLTLAIKLRPDYVVPLEERAKLYDLKNQPELARQDRRRLANYSRGMEGEPLNKEDNR